MQEIVSKKENESKIEKGKKNSFYVASLYVGVSIFYVVACA